MPSDEKSTFGRAFVEDAPLSSEMKRRIGEAADRLLWRDIAREFNFKSAMKGKAMLRKRAAGRLG